MRSDGICAASALSAARSRCGVGRSGPVAAYAEPARVVPHRGVVEQISRRRRLGEDLLPAAEARQREVRRRHEVLDHRHLARHAGRHLGGHLRAPRASPRRCARPSSPPPTGSGCCAGSTSSDRRRPAAPWRCSARRPRSPGGWLRRRRRSGRCGCRCATACARGARRRARAWRRRSALGSAVLGLRRRLDGVDVVMVRAGMVGILLQHALERGDDLRRLRTRLAVGRPEIPRPQVHQRLGEQRRRVEVVRDTERARLRASRRRRRGRAPCGRRWDRRSSASPARRCRPARPGSPSAPARSACCRASCAAVRALGVERQVDVRPERQRDAPVGHRAVRIEARRLVERAHRLVVVERSRPGAGPDRSTAAPAACSSPDGDGCRGR